MKQIGGVMPLVKIKEKFQVTIPNEIRSKIHLEIGDLLEAQVKNNTIVLKAKEVVDRNFVAIAIQEGLDDIKKGRVSDSFHSVDKMLEALHTKNKKKPIS